MPEKKKKYVEYGCCCGSSCGRVGGPEGITGCRFSLSPMSDAYVDIILEAVRQADVSKVYSLTDELSTVYRGRRQHVLDALKAGYRSLDTAQSYFNEEEVGSAMKKSGIPREEIFLTSKVWVEHYGYEEARKSVEERAIWRRTMSCRTSPGSGTCTSR